MPTPPAKFDVYRERANAFQLAELIRARIAGGDVRRFVPQWTGFEIPPAGSMFYVDAGALGVLWTDDAMTGQSNAPTMTIANLPDEIRPPAPRLTVDYVIDADQLERGGVRADPSGVLTFLRTVIVGSRLKPDAAGFAPTGVKGLPDRWQFAFPKV